MKMKLKLRFGLSILLVYIFTALSYAQVTIDTTIQIYGPAQICSGQTATVTVQNPQQSVQYRLLGPLKSTPIDTTFPRPTNSDYVGSLSFSGSDLNDGDNVLTVTGKNGNTSNKIPNGMIDIDGVLDEPYWNLSYSLLYMNPDPATIGDANSPYNAVNFGVLWDDNYLYIGVKVIDLTPNTSGGINSGDSDDIEIYIDPYSARTSYWNVIPAQLPIKQIRFGYLAPPNAFNSWPNNRTNGIQTATSTIIGTAYKAKAYDYFDPGTYITGTGYYAEFAIKWQDFFENSTATSPPVGFKFGFDLACNDNRLGTGRTEQTFWNSGNSYKWQISTDFGTMTLLDPINYPSSSTLSGLGETLIKTWTVNVKKTQPQFDYGPTAHCSDETNIPVRTIAGFSPGFFSSTVAGVTLESDNGTINSVNGSGVIPVNFMLQDSGPGCPPLSGTGLITIVGAPSIPTFNYGSGQFCNDVGNVFVTTGAGIGGGTYVNNATTPGNFFQTDLYTGNISNVSPNADGTFEVIYTVPSNGICGSIAGSAMVTFKKYPDIPVFTVTSPLVCAGTELGLTLIQNPQNTIIWEKKGTQNGAVYTSFSGGALEAKDSPTADTYYRVSVSNDLCPAQPSLEELVSITTPPLINTFYYPATKFGADQVSICSLEKLSPVAGPSSNGVFSSDLPLNVLNTATGVLTLSKAQPGAYAVTLTISQAGCTDVSKSFDLTITSSIGGTISSPIERGDLCEGQIATFTLSNAKGDSILWEGRIPELGGAWLPLASSVNFPVVSSTFSGNNSWNVKAVVKNGDCSTADSDIITFSSNLPSLGGLAVSKQTEICQDTPLDASVTAKRGAVVWYYSLDSTATAAKLLPATNQSSVDSLLTTDALEEAGKPYGKYIFYTAKVTNGNCGPAYSNKIKIKFCDQSTQPPNALVPNEGTGNSEWNLETMRLSDSAVIKVFNRYGVEVYNDTGANAKRNWWKGGNLPAGTYFYYIEQGEGHAKKTGAVTIIK